MNTTPRVPRAIAGAGPNGFIHQQQDELVTKGNFNVRSTQSTCSCFSLTSAIFAGPSIVMLYGWTPSRQLRTSLCDDRDGNRDHPINVHTVTNPIAV
jgi:hypothetical protein